MQTVQIKRAGRFGQWALRTLGFHAVTLPGKRIVILPDHYNDAELWAHELCHIRQIERDGWKFWPRCIWYVIRYGYWQSPYEIEARRAEKAALQ